MKDTHEFKGQDVAIFGFGVEGESVLQFLMNEGVRTVSIFEEKKSPEDDSIANRYNSDFVSWNYGPFPSHVTQAVLFRSPGLRPDLPVFDDARARDAVVTSSTSVFFSRCAAPIIGVTGTKGKGTTSSLIAEILKADGKKVFLGGNIGIPPLDFLDDVTQDSWVVLELSSFQLWDLTISPHIGVVVMVTSEHLDVHTDLSEYLSAKKKLLEFQSAGDYVVVNWDHENGRILTTETKAKIVKTSVKEKNIPGTTVEKGKIVFSDGEKQIVMGDVGDIALPGPHNVENVLSAVTAAYVAGVSTKAIQHGIRSFKGLPHRLEFVAEIEGVRYYDDSFSTTPETTIAAIRSFSQPKVLILGGSSKHSDFRELGQIVSTENDIRAIIGIGEEWEQIKISIQHSTVKIIEGCTSMRDIFSALSSVVHSGDVVLLSPACASFGMFRNYKDRGEQFQQEVNKLKHKGHR